MKIIAKTLTMFAALSALSLPQQAHTADDACLALKDFKLAGGRIDSVGTMTPPEPLDLGIKGVPPLPVLNTYCRVQGRLTPTPGSDIRIEVWLPPKEKWNGKFLGAGNAGYAGNFTSPYLFMGNAVGHGYASAGTDTGHVNGQMGDRAASGAGWALGQPEKVIDYGNRANHLTAAAAKSLVQAYYGNAPKYSYFQGCSNGGREALMEAQRYPEDYDGIIAGAPAYDWISLVAGMAWNTLARDALPDGMLPVAKLTVLQNAVLEQCDALDGVSDGWLDDPRRCAFDPGTVQCKSGDGDDCLSAAEVVAVRKIYSGPKTAAGKQIYPGFPPGSEAAQWNQWLTGAETDAAMFSTEYFRNMVFEKPDWELAQLNLDRDLPIARAKHDKIMVSNNPDLRAFAKRGGKLIMYHGWGDAAIPAQSTIAYRDAVRAKLGAAETDKFMQLYMVPGMNHCLGGPGPSDFDMIAAMERWVETKTPPKEIIAAKYANEYAGLLGLPPGDPVVSRPLCPYPQVALYKGQGSTDEAANFSCGLR